jgi:hypothetical protein
VDRVTGQGGRCSDIIGNLADHGHPSEVFDLVSAVTRLSDQHQSQSLGAAGQEVARPVMDVQYRGGIGPRDDDDDVGSVQPIEVGAMHREPSKIDQ